MAEETQTPRPQLDTKSILQAAAARLTAEDIIVAYTPEPLRQSVRAYLKARRGSAFAGGVAVGCLINLAIAVAVRYFGV